MSLSAEDILEARRTTEAFRHATSLLPPETILGLCDLATIGYAVVRRNSQALGARDLPGGAWAVESMVRLAKDAVDAYFERYDQEEHS